MIKKKYAYVKRIITIDQIAWLELLEKTLMTNIDYIDMVIFEVMIKCWTYAVTMTQKWDTWKPSDTDTTYARIEWGVIARALPLLNLSREQIKRRIRKLLMIHSGKSFLLCKRIRSYSNVYFSPGDLAFELDFKLLKPAPEYWQTPARTPLIKNDQGVVTPP